MTKQHRAIYRLEQTHQLACLLGVLLAGAAMTSVSMSAAEPLPAAPAPRERMEVEAVLAKTPLAAPVSQLRPLNILLLADEKDHGPEAHDYPLWQKRWKILWGGKQAGDTETQVNLYGPPASSDSKTLFAGSPKVTISTGWKWPTHEQFQKADLIVMYCYRSGGGHWLWDEQSPKDADAYLARGGGLVLIHSATYMDVDFSKPEWKPILSLTGLAFGKGNMTRREPMEIRLATDHPICAGMPPVLRLLDEPYWPAYGDPCLVGVLGTSEEKINKKSAETKPVPMFWTYNRGKGRIFGCVPGHFTWTFDDPLFRLVLLRGAAWAAGESPYRFDGLVLRGATIRNGAGIKP